MNRAYIHYDQSNLIEAISDFSKVTNLEFNENTIYAYYNRAICYKRQGQYDSALNDLDICTRMNSEFIHAYRCRYVFVLIF
jgi:tetratricopeptide (TPR) repeat protein